jgi:uncharacterized protein YlbG (UPF0298 family)
MATTRNTAPTVTATLELVKDTKNTRRYGEVVEDGQTPKVGTVYVQNADVEALGRPERIQVTLSAA